MAEPNITRIVQSQLPVLRNGYCHVCDRQVPISGNDNEEIKCTVCNGGFVELFEESPTQPQQEQPQQQNPAATRFNEAFPNFIFRSIQQPVNSQRIEFVVPGGEQLDFYGMLNNLITGLLGPTNQRQGPIQMFQFHGNLGDYAWGPAGLDSIITQLLNQLETSGPAPATDAQIAALANEVITNDHLERSDQCAICMDEYKLNDKAKKLPCKHYFHEDCVSQWLKLHGTCPVCRKTLSGEDTSQREYVGPAGSNQNNNNNQQDATNNTNRNQPNNSATLNQQNNNNTNRNNQIYDEPDFD